MLTKIHLERFRGFRLLDAAIEPVTVVIGPNSSGKTTLLHAVRVALAAVRLAVERETPKIPDNQSSAVITIATGQLLPDHTQLLPLSDWRALFLDLDVHDTQSFVLRLSFLEEANRLHEIEVEVVCGRNAQLKLNVKVKAPDLMDLIRDMPKRRGAVTRGERVREWVLEHVPRAVFVPAFYGVAKDEEYRSSAMVDRMLGAGDQSHILRNLLVRLEPNALDRLNGFLGAAMPGTTVSLRTERDRADVSYPLRVEFRDNNGGLELSSAGAGLVNLLALYASLERYRAEQRRNSVIFLFDEPEAHLHPRLQGEVASAIADAIREFGAQCLMATHSVEIVNKLSYRAECALIRVDRTNASASVLREEHQIVDELTQWVDLTPFSSLNLLASRQIVFHEGKSDQSVLKRCADVLFRNDLKSQDRFRKWHFAELSGSGNAKDVDALTRLLRSTVFTARRKNADSTVRVLQILDRDYERTPGVAVDPQAASPVLITRQVWSAHSIESLFLTAPILEQWIAATIAGPPTDLAARIHEALARADDDVTLQDNASDDLYLALKKRPRPNPAKTHSDSWEKQCIGEARELVRADPARWQRGKDRAAFVLGEIRKHLGVRDRNRFRTNLPALLDSADATRIRLPAAAVPEEIEGLLGTMVGIAFARATLRGVGTLEGKSSTAD